VASNTVAATGTVGSAVLQLAAAPDGKTIHTSNGAANSVSAVDTASSGVTAIPLAPFNLVISQSDDQSQWQ
jgi:YVTN family beta-propeller protein